MCEVSKSTPGGELYGGRFEPDQDRADKEIISQSRDEQGSYGEQGCRKGVAGVAAPASLSAHAALEKEQGEEQRGCEHDERGVVDESVGGAGTGAVYRVGLEGQERHRHAGDEEKRGTQPRPLTQSPVQADGEDDEQEPGDGEARVLEMAVGTEREPARPCSCRVREWSPADTDHEVVLRYGEGYEAAGEDRRTDHPADRRPPGRYEVSFCQLRISRSCLPYMLSSPWLAHNVTIVHGCANARRI